MCSVNFDNKTKSPFIADAEKFRLVRRAMPARVFERFIHWNVSFDILLLNMINEAAQRMTGCFITSERHACVAFSNFAERQ